MPVFKDLLKINSMLSQRKHYKVFIIIFSGSNILYYSRVSVKKYHIKTKHEISLAVFVVFIYALEVDTSNDH